MIESFNGIFYFILILILLLGNAYYLYSTAFNTKNWLAKYGVDESAATVTRFVGGFIGGAILMIIYIIFRGPEGTWAFWGVLFLQLVAITIAGLVANYFSDLGHKEGVIITPEAFIAPGILALITAIIIYGLSDKIYA